MVINEKALLAQMKQAYQNGGYRVLVSDSRMVFSNGYWLASIDKDNVPSKLLGMLAEHIREVPGEGQAYRVYKTKEGTIAQSAILEDALKPLLNMQEQRDEAWEAPNPPMMLQTPLTYNGTQLWQSLPGNDIYMIDPRYSVMISQKAEDVWKVGNGLYVQGEISELWVLRVVEGAESDRIKHLEAIAWAKK